jgi:hypothetical protein
MTIADLALLDDLADELKRGRIYECSLRSSQPWQIDGIQDGENICIDPRPAILETLLHALVHRRKPRLSERAVTITARNLAVRMDEQTKARWWRAYGRIKRKGKAVDVEES